MKNAKTPIKSIKREIFKRKDTNNNLKMAHKISARVLKGTCAKARGMMCRKNPVNLIFEFSKEKKIPLHMWFVRFPIDVYFLDKDKKIVEVKKNFGPWRCYKPKNKAQFVVETGADIYSFKVGEEIEWD